MVKNIVLDYKEDKELFNETAKAWAEEICARRGKDCAVKASQMRNFYDKVIDLNDKAQKGEDFDEILPFVKMINSKVQYALARKLVNTSFETMMKQCIDQVDSAQKLQVFKLFFEAVLGFYKGK